MAKAKDYTVKKSDNLEKIAKAHGFANWKALYGAKENAKLRKLRPDPNKIHPGDKVVIPQDRLSKEDAAALDKTIELTEKRILLMVDTVDELNKAVETTLTEMQKEVKRLDKRASITTVLDFFGGVGASLGKITKLSLKMQKASGAKLAALSNESGKEAAKMMGEPVQVAVFGIAKQKELEKPASLLSFNTWLNAVGHATSPVSLFDKTIYNLTQGKIPQKLAAGDVKGAGVTFVEAFGQDPQQVVIAATSQALKDIRSAQSRLDADITKELAMLQRLRAERKKFK